MSIERNPPHDLEHLLAQSAWLRRLARGLVRDPDGADELVQDTWIAAWRSAPAGDAANLGSWLSTVMRNFARRRQRDAELRERHESFGARPEAVPGPDAIATWVELQRELATALLALDEKYREALVLRYFHALSTRQVAHKLGLSHDNARQRISRGLAKLREHLDRDHGSLAWLTILARADPSSVSVAHAASISGGVIAMSTQMKLISAAVLVALAAFFWVERGSMGSAALDLETSLPNDDAAPAAVAEDQTPSRTDEIPGAQARTAPAEREHAPIANEKLESTVVETQVSASARLWNLAGTFLGPDPAIERLSATLRELTSTATVVPDSVATDPFGMVTGKLLLGDGSFAEFTRQADRTTMSISRLGSEVQDERFIAADIQIRFRDDQGQVRQPFICVQYHVDTRRAAKTLAADGTESTVGWSFADSPKGVIAQPISAWLTPEGVGIGRSPRVATEDRIGSSLDLTAHYNLLSTLREVKR